VAFDLYLDGVTVGRETWGVTHPDGGGVDIAFDASLEERGAKLQGSGSLSLASDLTVRAAELTLVTPDGPVKGKLAGAGTSMALTLSRGTESRDVRAEQASNVFIPQPFFVGFARLCPLLEAAAPALVEFPGNPLRVTGKRTISAESGASAAVTLYTVDRGGLGHTAVACEKGELVAALDPWTGQGAARTGRKALLDAVAVAALRQKPKTPEGMVEEDVTVVVPATPKDDEARLACSFFRPAPATAPAASTPSSKGAIRANARVPAVAFFSGSGPQDRDEDTVGPGGVKLSVFKTIAIALAARGIASLRCDDRGTARSTGAFEKATLSTFVRDDEEVVKALRARADVDGARVGVIGHSEGGVVAPVVARADGKLKAVLLMAAPGRSIPEIAVVQQRQLLEKAGLPKDEVEKQLAAQGEVLKAIQKGDALPAIVPQQERARIEGQRPWLKSHFDHDVQLALRQMPPASIFVAQGGRDAQIPPEEAELVQKGLAAGKNGKPKVVVYPTLNHVFAEGHGGSIAEYADPDATLDPTFLADVVTFFGQAFSLK
jgi:dienelactone hydrolase